MYVRGPFSRLLDTLCLVVRYIVTNVPEETAASVFMVEEYNLTQYRNLHCHRSQNFRTLREHQHLIEQVTSHVILHLYRHLMCSTFCSPASNCRSKPLHCHYVANCVIWRLQKHNSLGPTPYPDNDRDSSHKLLAAHKGGRLRGWKGGLGYIPSTFTTTKINVCVCYIRWTARFFHVSDHQTLLMPALNLRPNGATFRYADIILCCIWWDVSTRAHFNFSFLIKLFCCEDGK
jgi:hypothetical protein